MSGILSLRHDSGILNVSDSALIVGIDDTGHESFADEAHPLFGLGGCAVRAADYFRYLDDPWHELKKRYFGGPDIKLHASKLRNPSQVQVEALGVFFKNLPFFRFATVSARTARNETIETIVHLVSVMVMQQVAAFAQRTQPSAIVFIIETSERVDRALRMHFGAYRFGNGEIEIQPSVLLASKDARASCVEVADFVVHPAGAQVRNRLRGFKNLHNIIRKDFDAVFHTVDRKLVDYRELLEARPHRG